MGKDFAAAKLTPDQLSTIVNKLGGFEAALEFIHDEPMVTEPERKWHEKDDVIYFSVTSDGTTGEQWITRLEVKGFHVSEDVKNVLRRPDFVPTDGVTYDIASLKGLLFIDTTAISEQIQKEAERRGFAEPHPETACLIREKFSDADLKAMGLTRLIVMHRINKDPLPEVDKDFSDYQEYRRHLVGDYDDDWYDDDDEYGKYSYELGEHLFVAYRGDNSGYWLNRFCSAPGNRRGRSIGFAYAVK